MSRLDILTAPRNEPEAGGMTASYVWALLSALLLPVVIILVAVIARCLEKEGIRGESIRLGSHLYLPVPSFFPTQDVLQLVVLVAIVFVFSALFCLGVWRHRLAADRRASRIVRALHTKVLNQSLRRAEFEGAAAQHVHAQSLIGQDLPRLQKTLSLWYRSLPRNLLMLIFCVVVALLVDVWLAVLAVISGVCLWRLFRFLRGNDEATVSTWEVSRSRQRMAELVGLAPKLARLQANGLADQAFGNELDILYRRLDESDSQRGRIWPVLFLASTIAIALVILGLGINLLGDEKGLSLSAALLLGLALTGAVVSAVRLSELNRILKPGADASDRVYMYLRRNDDIAPTEQRVGFAGLRDGVLIQDVTLNDSSNKTILSHFSLELLPKSMVAILGTESISTRALIELLMGFGRPSEGRVSIDGLGLLDIHPRSLADNVMWIEPSGPIWDGSIIENLRGGDDTISNSHIVEALEKVDVYERLQRLPDGLNTYVTAGDTALDVEMTYGIAVARALLHKPPVLLASEPSSPENLGEDPCLAALHELVAMGTLVVILPRRLQTLRSASRVVLLNGPRLAGEGNHAELLTDSDLYRHLNYLLFNPYRHRN